MSPAGNHAVGQPACLWSPSDCQERFALIDERMEALQADVRSLRETDIPALRAANEALYKNGPLLTLSTMVARLEERLALALAAQGPHPKPTEVPKGSKLRYLPLWAYVLIGAGLVLGSDFLRKVGVVIIDKLVGGAVP